MRTSMNSFEDLARFLTRTIHTLVSARFEICLSNRVNVVSKLVVIIKCIFLYNIYNMYVYIIQ